MIGPTRQRLALLGVLLLAGCTGYLSRGSQVDPLIHPDVDGWVPPDGDGGVNPNIDYGGKKPDLPPPQPVCGGAPPTTQTFVMGTQVYATPPPAPPGKCKGIKDPNFGTLLVQVTSKADGYSDTGIQNEYARSDVENSDGSLLILRGNEAGWYLYSGTDFKLLKKIGDKFVSGDQEAEPRWDASNPKLLYYLASAKLMSINVDSEQSTTVHDFSGDGGSIATGSEGDASLDRNRWCFLTSGGSKVISYDRASDQVLGSKSAASKINWVSASMSGKHCVIGYDNGNAAAHPVDFSKTVTFPAGAVGHGDLALTADGRDVLVYQNAKDDFITMTDLDTGTATGLIQIPFSQNTDLGLHFSGNQKLKGWVLVSTYGAKEPEGTHSWMDNHLFLVELKASPRVWRVASTYTYTALSPSGEKHYFAEAYASINSRGTRVYWGGNWGQSDLDRIDLFAAVLPANWPNLLPK